VASTLRRIRTGHLPNTLHKHYWSRPGSYEAGNSPLVMVRERSIQHSNKPAASPSLDTDQLSFHVLVLWDPILILSFHPYLGSQEATSLHVCQLYFGTNVSVSLDNATDYGMKSQRSIPEKGKRFFFTPYSQDLIWMFTHPPIQWVQGLFLREQSGWRVNLTTPLQLVPTPKIIRQYLHLPFVFLK
jgi:hypothetical protein